MKTNIIILISFISIALVSCGKSEQHEIHQMENSHAVTHKLDVKVDNTLDPICEMDTKEFLSDTIHYQGKVYGFCSPSCKEEFAKNPTQYIVK